MPDPGGPDQPGPDAHATYRVHGPFTVPDLRGRAGVAAVGPAARETVRETYHDTQDLRLARSGVVLRHTVGGPDAGWLLRLPPVKGEPDEVRPPVGGSAVPDVLRDLVTAYARSAPLQVAASLRTQRTQLPLLDAAGVALAVLVDDVVSVLDGRHVAARFRELTVLPVPPAPSAPEESEGEAPAEEERPSAPKAADLHTPDLTADLTADAIAELAETAADFTAYQGGSQAAAGASADAPPAPDPGDVVAEVGQALVAAGALGGTFVPKSVRALGSRATRPPDPPPPGKVTPQDAARAAVTAHLRTNVRAFIAQDSLVRRDWPDSIHQMRVAARRLRSGLRTFGPLLDPAWSGALSVELKWAASSLGDARDAEVQLARFTDNLADLDEHLVLPGAAAALTSRLERDYRRAHDAALAMMRTERYLALLERLVEAATEPHTLDEAERPGAEMLPPLVTSAWKKLAKKVRRIDRDNETGSAPDVDYHAARIKAKRTRYAADACAPVFGAPAKAFAAAMSDVTEILGEHQDAHVAGELLRDLAGEEDGRAVSGAVGFTYGILYAVQRRASQQAREQFYGVWTEVSRRRYHRWLKA